MRLALLFVATVAASVSAGCSELLDLDGGNAASGGTSASETACASRSARGVCTQWVAHETPQERWLRETADETSREQAFRKGEPFIPRERPGDSTEEDVRRMREENRRQEAYRRGEPFFPDHQAGESTDGYLHRMQEERRRQEAYRNNEPFIPGASR